MKPLRFYEHFACAYGTIWLLLLACSFAIQEHIDAGAFGLFGFPVIALIYAFVRRSSDKRNSDEIAAIRGELDDLRQAQRRSQE
jgi:hypothetical protein